MQNHLPYLPMYKKFYSIHLFQKRSIIFTFFPIVKWLQIVQAENQWSCSPPETICAERVYGNNFKDCNI